jgi:hypothetical protein
MEISSEQFALKMYSCDDSKATFKYPVHRLLPLRDLIAEECMRNPDILDHDNEAWYLFRGCGVHPCSGILSPITSCCYRY